MKRRLIGIAVALTLGVAPVIVVQAPAFAAFKACTASGHHYCLGASNLNAGTIITNSSSGRAIVFQDRGFTHGGFEVYELQFADDRSKCVGFSSNGLAEVRDCSGNSNFTNWENDRSPDGTTTLWLNNSFNFSDCATPNDQGVLLSSDNALGDRAFCSENGRLDDYTVWTPAPSP